MDQKANSINRIFIHTLLIVAMVCSFIVLLVDVRGGFDDKVAIIADSGIFLSSVLSYFITRVLKKDTLSVVLFTGTVLALMTYQLLSTWGYYLGISIMVVIVLGYVYSLILKGTIRLVMHGITLFVLVFVLVYQYNYPEHFVITQPMDLMGIAIPYLMVYILVSLTAALLKDRLDESNQELVLLNKDLVEKNCEIETQNEELNSHQEEMNSINVRLEELVEQRTHSLREKNEALARYGFRNAHNVRGPLARILGLINLSKMDKSITPEMILSMIEKEALQIDYIIHEIARDLGENTEVD